MIFLFGNCEHFFSVAFLHFPSNPGANVGGNGGRGGDVILECSPRVWDFSGLQPHLVCTSYLSHLSELCLAL